jgi:hypothetical protein
MQNFVKKLCKDHRNAGVVPLFRGELSSRGRGPPIGHLKSLRSELKGFLSPTRTAIFRKQTVAPALGVP